LTPWTTSFELPVGATDLLSHRLEFGRFLTEALPFMSTIDSISLYFDSTPLLYLSRTKAEGSFDSPNSTLWSRKTPVSNNPVSKTSAFKTIIDSIKVTNVLIDAEVSRWLDWTDQAASQTVREFKNVQLWSASAKIHPSDDSRKKLEKATKKTSIPEKSEVQIMFVSMLVVTLDMSNKLVFKEEFSTQNSEKQYLIPQKTAGYVAFQLSVLLNVEVLADPKGMFTL
jgi:hypothetical protein